MSVLGIEVTSRDPDRFAWQLPNTHGHSPEYLAAASKTDALWQVYYAAVDRMEEGGKFDYSVLDRMSAAAQLAEREQWNLFRNETARAATRAESTTSL